MSYIYYGDDHKKEFDVIPHTKPHHDACPRPGDANLGLICSYAKS